MFVAYFNTTKLNKRKIVQKEKFSNMITTMIYCILVTAITIKVYVCIKQNNVKI